MNKIKKSINKDNSVSNYELKNCSIDIDGKDKLFKCNLAEKSKKE